MCQIQDPIGPRPVAAGTQRGSPRTRSARLHRFEFRRSQFVLIFTLLLGASSADALAGTNGIWTDTTAGGLWSNPSNWSGGVVANGIDAVADFSTLDLTADNTVHLNGPRTVGALIFGDTTPTSNWTLSGSSVLTLATSSGTPVIQINNQTATIAAAINGVEGMTKVGGGTLMLTGADACSGQTSINAGTLQLNNANAVQNSTVAVDTGNGLVFGPGIGTFTFGGLSGSGGFFLTDTGGAPVTLRIGNSGAFYGTTIYSGIMSGIGSLIVSGGAPTSPELILTGANTFSGTTSLNLYGFQSYLQLANGNALQNSTLTGSISVNNVTFSPGIGTFTLGGLSASVILLNDTSGAPITLRVGNNNASTTAGDLFGSGSLNKIGTGTLTFASHINYTGVTTVDAGSVQLSDPFLSFLSGAVVVNVNNGLQFGEDTMGLNTGYYIGGLSGSGNFSLADVKGEYVELEVGGNNMDTTYSGSITGVGTLAKLGTGTLTLSGANTYGFTAVSRGTVEVTGSLINNGSSGVFVAPGNDFTNASIVRRVQPGDSYAGLGAGLADGGADIRAGQNSNSAPNDVAMQWRVRNISEVPFSQSGSVSPSAGLHGLDTDVLNLSGMSSATGNPDQTDPFALQIAYSSRYYSTDYITWL
ncbi:MAG TPA: autotransporter-associated beta strand repeat-containing protein, partial [Pirellulales bacterium]|nr:autotransporter-associated beta strand repeat-containing protein [Pirellulales bacterium]